MSRNNIKRKKIMKFLRILDCLSQRELAEKVNVSQAAISMIETSHLEPRGNLRKTIAKMLDTTPEKLFPEA